MKKADEQNLQKAFFLHQNGNLNEAANLYRQLIEQNSNNFQALHYLGVIESVSGNLEQAKSLMARSLANASPNIQFMENYATILFQTGDYKNAVQVCQQGLRIHNVNAALLYVSAISLFKLNQLQESLRQFDKLLANQPNHITAVNERGSVLAEMGEYDAALASFEKALALNPQYAQAQLNKANLFGKIERQEEAIAAYDKALTLKPDLADAWLGRGNVFTELKRYDDAFAAYDKALALEPDLANAWLGRGNVFHALKRHDDALAAYDRALALKPDLPDAWHGRGNVFEELKRYNDAFAAYDKALAVKPDFAEAWLGRGNVFRDLGRDDEAFAAYDRALAFKSDLDGAWLGRGNVFANLKRYDEALAAYDRALALKPDFPEAWQGRSEACKATGRFAEALSSYEKRLELTTPKDHNKYDNIIALGKAIFSLDCIPAIYDEESNIKENRTHLVKMLEAINSELDIIDDGAVSVCPQSIINAVFHTNGFYISYQQENDRDLMRSYSQILQRIIRLDGHSPVFTTKRADKIRFGIASELLKNHSGVRYAYEWLSHLPSDDYEFFIYAFHNDVDDVTLKFEKLGTFKRLLFGPSSFHSSVDLMKADNLHFLMLPDVGMSASSRILSQHRIAPVQFTSWGHPVTTGSANIDYFLSSDLMEIPDADEHYTERLIRLPNTSRFIERDSILFDDSAAFDLPEELILYGCLQSLFKLLPQYDFIYPQIAKRVPGAYFVFIEGEPSYMTAILKQRLTRAFERDGLSADDHIRFLPRMGGKQYASLFKAIHVNIDSIGWSGGYTTIQCLEADCPIVTLPTQFMRGRHSYAMLKQMGMDELVATSTQDFIDKLSQLGADSEWRHTVVEKISQNKHRLYRDSTVIEAFDAFLKNEFSKLSS